MDELDNLQTVPAVSDNLNSDNLNSSKNQIMYKLLFILFITIHFMIEMEGLRNYFLQMI